MKIRVLLSLGLIGIAAARPALATRLVRMSLEQLSQASTAIVRGRVLKQESRWNSNHTRIITLTTLEVSEAMKGAPPSVVTVQQLGGTVGNIHVYVAGAVRFHPETEYVLFLEPAGAGTPNFLVVGMAQGAYRIYRDATTRAERVIRLLGGVYDRAYMAPQAGAEAGATGLGAAGLTLPLSGFRQQVARAVNSPILIPGGTSIPVTIDSAEPRGAGRVRVSGRTAASVFPSSDAVVPAGSSVEGDGQMIAGVWRIRWTELSVRGTRVPISATSVEASGKTLQGRALVIHLR